MPREQLEQIQLKRLQKTAKLCYKKVPFYKKALDEKGVKPGDIQSLSDLSILPFTVKDDLRDNYPFKMFTKRHYHWQHLCDGSSGI